MPDEVNFEVFCRQDPKSGWTLQDVSAKREDALKLATAMVAGKRAAAVKVIKQAYDPKTSDYLSLKIFEAGHEAINLDPKAEDVPPAKPCTRPEDFYTREARLVIARLLGDYLARQRLTAIELLHRADALEVFESTNSVFQHAVQRIAVAQSASTDTNVQEIIKTLNALVIEAMHRVYHDEERKRFPNTAEGGFGALASAIAHEPEGAYIFNAALARHLKSAASWDSKLVRLLAVLNEAPREGEGRTLVLQSADAVIEEILNGSASLYELIGGRESLNAALNALTDLFLGEEQSTQKAQPGLAALTQCFAAGALPQSRQAVANRILAELKSTKRLCPASITDEIKALRRVATRLMAGVGKYLGPEDLAAAFTLRSKRVVTLESLNEVIANALTPDEKLERLLFVQDNIVGAANKRQLASFIMPFISGGSFESHFLAARPSPAAALKRLAEHQARVLRSGFTKEQREDIAAVLDRLSNQVEMRTGFFKSIEAKTSDAAEKAILYLNLCKGGITEGRLSARARKTAIGHMVRPDFMSRFAARLARTSGAAAPDPAAELTSMLQAAGIDPDEVFNAGSVRPAA